SAGGDLMALTVIATPGASNANSYATLVEADAYFEGRVGGDAWAEYSDDERERALVDATTTLDARRFGGYRANDTQALAWPRSGVAYDGVAVSDSAIPVFVRNATCEQA